MSSTLSSLNKLFFTSLFLFSSQCSNVCVVEEFFFFNLRARVVASTQKKSLIVWSIFSPRYFFSYQFTRNIEKSNINCTLRITYFLITLTIVFVVVEESLSRLSSTNSHMCLLDCNLWLKNELMSSRRSSHKREVKVQSSKQFFTLYIFIYLTMMVLSTLFFHFI